MVYQGVGRDVEAGGAVFLAQLHAQKTGALRMGEHAMHVFVQNHSVLLGFGEREEPLAEDDLPTVRRGDRHVALDVLHEERGRAYHRIYLEDAR